MRIEEADDLMEIAIASKSTNNLIRMGITSLSQMMAHEIEILVRISDQLSIISTTLMNIDDRLSELEGRHE